VFAVSPRPPPLPACTARSARPSFPSALTAGSVSVLLGAGR